MKKFSLLFVLFISQFGFGQQVNFEHISQNDGLPSPTITSILKDSYGFMWFGSRRGLVKYDGYSYTVFDEATDITGEKITNFFFSDMIQLNDSTLLLALNYSGFYEFNLYTEEFILRTDSLESCVYSILKDKKDNIWLGTSNGLMSYNLKSQRIKTFKFGNEFPHHQDTKNHTVSAIEQDKSGNLWIYVSNGYIGLYNPQSEKFKFIQYSTLPFSHQLINHGGQLLLDQNKLWIGTEYDGVYAYDISSKTFTHFSKELNTLPSNVIRDFHQDQSGTLWVATDGGGLLQYEKNSATFKSHTNVPTNPKSISGNAIYTIYGTSDDILWIGTYAAGLNLYKKNKAKFKLLNNTGPLGSRLSYKSVLSFAESKNGLILIGTDGGGINIFDKNTGRITPLTTSNSELHSDIVNTLFFDSEGYLWSGSYGKGVCRYTFDKELKKNSPVFLDGKSCWEITEDLSGTLWFGSLNSVYTCKVDSNKFSSNPPKLLFETQLGSVKDMGVDSNGLVWICTSTIGICYYDMVEKQLHSITHNRKKSQSLPSNNVTSFHISKNGKHWIGSEYGDFAELISFKQNKVKRYPNNQSKGKSVNAILEDSRGRLWLSTDNGILLFDNGTFTHFGLDDGIQSLEFNIGASFKDSEGLLYFGGIEGLNYFNPLKIGLNDTPPPIYITSLKLFNTTLKQNSPFNGHIHLTQPAHLTKNITLNYDENILSLGFAALDYIAPQQNQYRYKLEGFDEDWVLTSAHKREVTYTNLPPGTYTFKVSGSNNDGRWNEKWAALTITVLPPWWMTWWFRTLLALLGLVVIIAVYYLRLKQIQRKNKELAQLVDLKTSELQHVNDNLLEKNQEALISNEKLEAQNEEISRKSDRIQEQQQKIILQLKELETSHSELNHLNDTKDKFFSIIAHDLRNPVSAIHSLSELLARNFKTYPDFEKEQFVQQILQSSEQLQKLTVDLLDWAATQTQHYRAQAVSINLHELIDHSITSLALQASQKNILISNETDPLHFVMADPKMLGTVVRNLVSNAIKFSGNGKVVRLFSNTKTNDTVTLSIQDQGIGMSTEKINQLFSLENKTSSEGTNNEEGVGLGLIICKEFISLNKGSLEFDSQENVGTTAKIILPQTDYSSTTVQQEKVPSKDIKPVDLGDQTKTYKGRKILIIDDDPKMRKILQAYLSEVFEVYEADNGEEGLAIAQKTFPELVISDLNMPAMNGFEFCSKLKSDPKTSHIPCIILTGQTESDIERRAFEAGANAFLTKPYDGYILIRRIINQLKTRDQIHKKFSTETDFEVSAEIKDQATQDFLHRCIEFVEAHIADTALHADDLCKELGLSKTLLYEKIKTITGLTVNEFIKITRLKRSVTLLKQGQLNISQIAIEVGFNSLSYFTRNFTKQYGTSPSAFLKQQ